MFLHLSVILFGGVPGRPPGQTPPPQDRQHPASPAEMATSADGTRPTGMHSCVMLRERFLSDDWRNA